MWMIIDLSRGVKVQTRRSCLEGVSEAEGVEVPSFLLRFFYSFIASGNLFGEAPAGSCSLHSEAGVAALPVRGSAVCVFDIDQGYIIKGFCLHSDLS